MPKIKPLLAICLSTYLLLSACDGESSSNSSVREDFELPETPTPRDTDGDGRLDDFDGDGVSDFARDTDGDGRLDDFDSDGVSDFARDTDGDGVPDSEDFIDNRVAQDTDGDGLLDDFDGDGIPDF